MICRIMLLMWLFFPAQAAIAGTPVPSVETILTGLEARYAAGGLEARFTQLSVLQAMDLSDSAEGRLWLRRPGQMRWQYTVPEPQTIVSDGTRLWIYRPVDRQVTVGAAPSFFGEGRGAGFLSDIGQLRRQFDITASPDCADGRCGLILVPQRKQPDLVRIELEIALQDFTIQTITTFNAYGDKTRIALYDVVFHDAMDDALFRFQIPEDAEIIQMDE